MGPRLKLPKYVHGFVDRHGKPRFYFRRPGFETKRLRAYRTARSSCGTTSLPWPISRSRCRQGAARNDDGAGYKLFRFA